MSGGYTPPGKCRLCGAVVFKGSICSKCVFVPAFRVPPVPPKRTIVMGGGA